MHSLDFTSSQPIFQSILPQSISCPHQSLTSCFYHQTLNEFHSTHSSRTHPSVPIDLEHHRSRP
jgi:hypothetical protein